MTERLAKAAIAGRRRAPAWRPLRAAFRGLARLIPENRAGDRFYAWISFVLHHRRLPTTRPLFNDVLHRIKTTDEILDPLRVFVSDKEFVKVYVKAAVGDRYNVPTLGVIRDVAAVDAYPFPADCCIKPTHASGRVIMRRAGAEIDRSEIRRWFAINHYRFRREANYRTLRPKVIVEPLLFDDTDVDNYRFFCVDGRARLIFVELERFTDHRRSVFDTQWNAQDYAIGFPRPATSPPRPGNLEEMLAVAQQLASAFGFVRVDMYSDGAACYVGEITHCHAHASQSFIPLSSERSASKVLFG